MSEERKRSRAKWLNWLPAPLRPLAVLVAYQGAHYATAALQPADCFYVRAPAIVTSPSTVTCVR
jgi:hypothetical protein